MNIPRKIIETIDWQCMDGTIIPVTKMTDNHLRNSIHMIRRQMKTNNDQKLWDSYLILKAEQKFRKSTKKTNANQLCLDFQECNTETIEMADAVKVCHKRLNGIGLIGRRLTRNCDILMKAVDDIGSKHHGFVSRNINVYFDDFDDLESDFGDWGNQD